MLVQRLGINNVKCFAKGSEIDLLAGRESPHKWVVVYGDNGLGKSTLLRSLGIALTGQPALNTLFSSAEGWVGGRALHASISLSIQKGTGDRSNGAPRTMSIGLGLILVGSRLYEDHSGIHPAHSIFYLERLKEVFTEHGQRTTGKQLDEDVKLFKEHISSDEPKRGWLICGYGPHRRLTGASSELSERIPPDGRAARLVTLFHEGAALTSSERWLLKLHHYASLDKKGGAQRRLDAIVQIINTSLLHGDVQLHEITPEGVFFKTPFSAKIPFGDLSDGYRSVLALTLDVLRHVEYAFDIEDVLEKKGDRWVVTAEGVVLIDEIDAHLHPSWQRTIGAWLHERFPNIQFIVTTHSPLIATRVSETERLHGRAREKKVTPTERKKLRALEAEYERIAPATPTYAGVEAWREDEDRIRLANEKAAYGHRCLYCDHAPVRSVDHQQAKSASADGALAWDNFRPSCGDCNLWKGTMVVVDPLSEDPRVFLQYDVTTGKPAPNPATTRARRKKAENTLRLLDLQTLNDARRAKRHKVVRALAGFVLGEKGYDAAHVLAELSAEEPHRAIVRDLLLDAEAT